MRLDIEQALKEGIPICTPVSGEIVIDMNSGKVINDISKGITNLPKGTKILSSDS